MQSNRKIPHVRTRLFIIMLMVAGAVFLTFLAHQTESRLKPIYQDVSAQSDEFDYEGESIGDVLSESDSEEDDGLTEEESTASTTTKKKKSTNFVPVLIIVSVFFLLSAGFLVYVIRRTRNKVYGSLPYYNYVYATSPYANPNGPPAPAVTHPSTTVALPINSPQQVPVSQASQRGGQYMQPVAPMQPVQSAQLPSPPAPKVSKTASGLDDEISGLLQAEVSKMAPSIPPAEIAPSASKTGADVMAAKAEDLYQANLPEIHGVKDATEMHGLPETPIVAPSDAQPPESTSEPPAPEPTLSPEEEPSEDDSGEIKIEH